MSKEIRSFSFPVVIADVEDWDTEDIEAAEKDDSESYADYAVNALRTHMLEAGKEFVYMHPEMFSSELV